MQTITTRRGQRPPSMAYMLVSGEHSTDKRCLTDTCVWALPTNSSTQSRPVPMPTPTASYSVAAPAPPVESPAPPTIPPRSIYPMRRENLAGAMATKCGPVYNPSTGTVDTQCRPIDGTTEETQPSFLQREFGLPPRPARGPYMSAPQTTATTKVYDPAKVFWGQARLAQAAAGPKELAPLPDVHKAAALAAANAGVGRAQYLMDAFGIDYNTANAMAQREVMQGSGYYGSGVASGVIPAATKAIENAAALEAERMQLAGIYTPTKVASGLFGSAPGTIFTGEGGVPQRVSATGSLEALPVRGASEDMYTAALLRSATVGDYVSEIDRAQARLQAIRQRAAQADMQATNEILKAQQRLEADKARALLSHRLRLEEQAARQQQQQPLPNAEIEQAARAAYNNYVAGGGTLPYAMFKPAWEQAMKKQLDAQLRGTGGNTATTTPVTPAPNPATQAILP